MEGQPGHKKEAKKDDELIQSGHDYRDGHFLSSVPLSLHTIEGMGRDDCACGLTIGEVVSIVHLSLKYVPLARNETDLPEKDNYKISDSSLEMVKLAPLYYLIISSESPQSSLEFCPAALLLENCFTQMYKEY